MGEVQCFQDATVADTAIASATTTSSAVAGTYSLEVTQLARQHSVASGNRYRHVRFRHGNTSYRWRRHADPVARHRRRQ
ncbi:flagellar cap protein FliD N-terminal domain-containing protein [Candidatus Accumulibacter necessarius]|uniref:flagellar cap protein FliD N-terminal domain-containing protein n=1 Tax=Candidatus Accumulibacter necessarius TaxID=2954386 RepID=UPI003DA8F2A0